MIADVSWRDETQTIVKVTVAGESWSAERFQKAMENAHEKANSVRYGVVVLLNLLQLPNIPAAAVHDIESAFKHAPPNCSRLILVTDQPHIDRYFIENRHSGILVIKSMEDLF